MDLEFRASDPFAGPVGLLALPLFSDAEGLTGPLQELDRRVNGALNRARTSGDIRGKDGDTLTFYLSAEGGPSRVTVVGCGSLADADGETFRKLGGRAVREAEKLFVTDVAVAIPGLIPSDPPGQGGTGDLREEERMVNRVGPDRVVQATAEGLALAGWDFRELITQADDPSHDDEDRPPLVTGARIHATPVKGNGTSHGDGDVEGLAEAVRVGRALAAGQNLARDLQSRPGNVATPTHLAEVALQLAEEHGFGSRILGPEEMEEEEMGALLSVARGSDQEPRLIVLEHRGGGGDQPPLALVGKGLTFDSGGISLKPAKGMESMKYDMSGGAAVLGAMKAIGLLGLPVNVVGVVPSSENLINGSANKPGDVIRTRAGKTVEIINTDAEGRLILADALSYTRDHYGPSAMVDCATLTGACVVALGHHAAALLGSDEGLQDELREAGELAGERCWPLPLWKPYRKQLKSQVADLKNVGGRPAGAITAGWFLSEFAGDTPWAHLDVAGTAYGDTELPYRRDGAFGFPTRLLVEWVRSRVG